MCNPEKRSGSQDLSRKGMHHMMGSSKPPVSSSGQRSNKNHAGGRPGNKAISTTWPCLGIPILPSQSKCARKIAGEK